MGFLAQFNANRQKKILLAHPLIASVAIIIIMAFVALHNLRKFMVEKRENVAAGPFDWMDSFNNLANANTKKAEEFFAELKNGPETADLDRLGLLQAWSAALQEIWTNPQAAMDAYSRYWQDSMQLWQHSMHKMMGGDSDAVIDAEQGDRRFRSEQWSEDAWFSHLKQSYLLTSRALLDTLGEVKNLDENDKLKLDFYSRQMIDAASPSNFIFSNPDVIKATVDSSGQNLVDGWKNLTRDVERGGGQLQIKMTDFSAFELGKNIAATPGDVVYQNRMMQLIQYRSTSGEVYKKPLLIVPPWINKFYVLDMQEKNSMVRWLVEQGHTVFVISWVNPDASYAGIGFEEYMLEGPVKAQQVIAEITGETSINAIGYCLGGTLLAATLAWFAAREQKPITSATFLASLIDFSEPGEIKVFVDEKQVSQLEEEMQKTGYLDGSSMASSFGMLRANDLIWSFVINNYLLGKEPRAFDLLYWNADSTRMPAKMHSFYLRKMYLENVFKDPGGIELDGIAIDISKVDIPVYFVSTLDDHIAPWATTYLGARIFSGPVRFILGESGHIAGIVNPPSANKYGYYSKPGRLPKHVDAWYKGAKHQSGSWWLDWQQWLQKRGKVKVSSRSIGSESHPALEPAPGSYVRERIVNID